MPFLFLLPAGEDFYSHAREGRDPKSMVNLFWFIISTHTPARGVTLQRQRVAMNCNFYSHAREGRDADRLDVNGIFANFYSHAREGRDIGYFISVGS